MKIKYWLSEGGIAPTQATYGSVGFDLYATERYSLDSDMPTTVETGVHLQIPEGYMGTIRGRSGLAFQGVNVHLGTIDSDYRGEVCVIMTSSDFYEVLKGERVAQLVVTEVPKVELEAVEDLSELRETSRGEGGFGSTGRT